MGQINDQGVWMYADNDIVQSWPVFMNLGFNSVSDVVKGLQKGRVIIANNAQDYDTKLAAIRKAGGGQYDVLIYRKDTREFLINTNGQLVKIAGGEVETAYVHNNSGFGTWYRYAQHGANATLNQTIQLPKAGMWLISTHLTITNDTEANNANIDILCSLNGGVYNNLGALNTYTHNNNVYSFRGADLPFYASTPNKNVSVSMKISCSPSYNVGWGGLTIGAAKIG